MAEFTGDGTSDRYGCHAVLDVRVYRTAFLPALLALFVAAFSLTGRPAALSSPSPPDAFDGARAAATLRGLARTFPDRAAGSAGDRRLAGYIARTRGHRGPRTGGGGVNRPRPG